MLEKIAIVASIILLLIGCNTVKNTESNYWNSPWSEPLRIPPGVSSMTIENHYHIPNLPKTDLSSKAPVNLVPPRVIPS